jgi:hypothetical protein
MDCLLVIVILIYDIVLLLLLHQNLLLRQNRLSQRLRQHLRLSQNRLSQRLPISNLTGKYDVSGDIVGYCSVLPSLEYVTWMKRQS